MQKERGFTLIEIMVAMVVMAIGLLGMAGMQVVASKYKINTWARSSVSELVSDIAERIRVNSDAAGTNVLHGGVQTDSEYVFSSKKWSAQQGDDLPLTKDCASASCSTDERAAYDMTVWRRHVRDLLPQGAVWLVGDKGEGFDVTLMWFDKEFTEGIGSIDRADTANERKLKKSQICTADLTGMGRQSCCPADADVVEGVRCMRYRFVP